MKLLSMLQSAPGRLVRGVVGCALVAAGVHDNTLGGVVLVVVGLVPIVSAAANICLVEDLATSLADLLHRRSSPLSHKS